MLKYFTTAYLGTVGTILVHGLLLIFFIAFGLEVPQVVKSYKVPAREVEITMDEDFLVQEEQIIQEENPDSPKNNNPSDVKNAIVDENDNRERDMEEYSVWNKDEVDKEIESNLKNIEKDVIAGRRADGKTLKEIPDDKSTSSESVKSQGENSNSKSGNSGNAYGGTATVSYNLPGRKPRNMLRAPAWNCLQGGTVVVTINVNPIGEIIELSVDQAASSGNSCLYSYALDYAKKEKFNRDETKPKKQSGSITYVFVAQ